MLTIVREQGERMIRSQDPSALPAALADKTRPFWLDLESPETADFDMLHNLFNFHPLAIEDAMRPHQRPKIDEYEGYFFLVADEVHLRLDSLQTRELSGSEQEIGRA